MNSTLSASIHVNASRMIFLKPRFRFDYITFSDASMVPLCLSKHPQLLSFSFYNCLQLHVPCAISDCMSLTALLSICDMSSLPVSPWQIRVQTRLTQVLHPLWTLGKPPCPHAPTPPTYCGEASITGCLLNVPPPSTLYLP